MNLPRPDARRLAEWGIYAVLFAFLVCSRLVGIGEKALMHDESLFVYYSYFTIHEDLIYKYEPVLHGPAMLWIQAAIFSLFGDSDFTTRLGAGLLGIGGFFWIVAMRRWLGRVGTPVALAFYAASGALMYYQRFFRNDALFVFATLWIVASAANWWHSRRPGWLVSLVLSLVVLFCNKESSVFIYFTLATFLLMLVIHDLARGLLEKRADSAESTEPRVPPPSPVPAGVLVFLAGFLFLTRILEGIQFDADVVESLGHDFVLSDVRSVLLALGWIGPVENAGLLGTRGFWRIFYPGALAACLAFGIGLHFAVARGWGSARLVRGLWSDLWQRRFWLLGALCGGLFVYQFLFTTAFQFQLGPFEAYHKTLAYWMGQHAMHRLQGPFHMHLVNMVVYEMPEVLLVLGVWIASAGRGGWDRLTGLVFLFLAAAFLFFHLWVFRGLDVPMLYFRHLGQVSLLAAIGLCAWPRAGRIAWPVLALLFVGFSIAYFNSPAWSSFLAAPVVRGGATLAPTGLKHIDDTLSLNSGAHLFLIAFLMLFGTFATWRSIQQQRRFQAFLFWWLITMAGAASYAREKVPWVGIHIAVPLVLLAGIYAQRFAAWACSLSVPRRRYAALAAGGCALVLAAGWNARAALHASFGNPGDVRERISAYSETPMDLKRHALALRELAAEGAATGLLDGLAAESWDTDPFDPEWTARHSGTVVCDDVRVLIVNDDVIWPMRWYLRDIEWQERTDLTGVAGQDWPIVIARRDALDDEAFRDAYALVRGRGRMYWLSEPADYRAMADIWRVLVPGSTTENEEAEKALIAQSRSEWVRFLRYLAFREVDPAAPGMRTSTVEYLLGVRRDLIRRPGTP
ncbi:MAG: hypothetical protein PWP23_985 [Candidatus Sumerlaeota bacterium]|nr:hypothetical protein [Candidatus Sumerlaeota bacterium]